MIKLIFKFKVYKLDHLPRLTYQIISLIKLPSTIILEGNLASGKTTLIRELASKLRINKSNVSSPTFNIVNQHKGRFNGQIINFNHFDLYRIDNEFDLINLPFDYFFKNKYLNCIEWGEDYLSTIYEYSERVYMVEIIRDDNIKNEEFRIINLYLVENID